jgi:hypothetical protein
MKVGGRGGGKRARIPFSRKRESSAGEKRNDDSHPHGRHLELSVQDPGSAFVIELLPVSIQGEPKCLEHEALVWEEEENLSGYDLAPSDRRYLEARLESGGDARPDS